MNVTSYKATLLSPLNYGSIAVQGGSATIPFILGDVAFCFALAQAKGCMLKAPFLRTYPNYKEDLDNIPWRSSLLFSTNSELLSPIAKRLDLGIECGRQNSFVKAASSGNVKEFWKIQEISPGAVYHGALFYKNENPISNPIVIRMGQGRQGILYVEPLKEKLEDVYLNAHTAYRFNQTLPVKQFVLHTIQMTKKTPLEEAKEQVSLWL